MTNKDTAYAMSALSQEQALSFCEEHLRAGHQRWVITGLTSEAFHQVALSLSEVFERRGIVLGSVYYVPEQAGVLFVKQEGFPQ